MNVSNNPAQSFLIVSFFHILLYLCCFLPTITAEKEAAPTINNWTTTCNPGIFSLNINNNNRVPFLLTYTHMQDHMQMQQMEKTIQPM